MGVRMDVFKVWVQPMDHEYRVSVDGSANANWLVDRLSRAFVFKSALPIDQNARTSLCTFQIPYTSMLPFEMFRKLLLSIPEVTLVMHPVLIGRP